MIHLDDTIVSMDALLKSAGITVPDDVRLIEFTQRVNIHKIVTKIPTVDKISKHN